MQKLKQKPNDANDITPAFERPDVAQQGGVRDFTNLKIISVGILFTVVVVGYVYHSYIAGRNKDTKPIKSLEAQEIVGKDWILGKVGKALEEDSQERKEQVAERPFPASKIKRDENRPIFKKKTSAFAKYKSIPTKTDENSEDEEVRGESKIDAEDEDAVIARSIAIDPDFLLQEGTYIPCSLTMRFVSEVAGRIQCLINQDIYGASGRVKLIERGTKAIGVYQSGTLGYGMARMHVIWTKLLTPDYKRVNLVDTQVVGRLGEAGIDGRVNSHFAQRFGGALMVSLIKDVVAGVSAKHSGGTRKNTININTFENTKDSTTSIVERMLDASINIPPTMYKKQGDIIGIEVGKDIDFSKIYSIKSKKTK